MEDSPMQQPEQISQAQPPQSPFRHWLPTIVGIIVIVLAVGGFSAWQFFQTQEDEGIGVPQTTDVTANWETYRNEEFGFEVKYPSDTFNVASIPDGISLLSPYFITDNPSGLPGKEIKHAFSIDFQLRNMDILNAIKTEVPHHFSQTFPDDTIESFKITDGSVNRLESANRDGFSFWSGFEGLNTTYIFLPKNSGETLVVQFNNFDNKMFRDPPPSANISIEKQTEIFNSVISTLKFLGDSQTADETANWQTYRNEEFGFEVKYPDNWQLDLSEAPSAFIIKKGSSQFKIDPDGNGRGFFFTPTREKTITVENIEGVRTDYLTDDGSPFFAGVQFKGYDRNGWHPDYNNILLDPSKENVVFEQPDGNTQIARGEVADFEVLEQILSTFRFID